MNKTAMLLWLALGVAPLMSIDAFAAQANGADACVPVLKDGWIRLPPMANAPMVAGFGTLENPCKAPVDIVSAQSPAFASVSLHQSMQMNGMNMMHELQSLPIAAGKSVAFAPGSYHLMLMQPSAALVEGETVAIAFTLKDGRKVDGVLQVKKTAP